VASDNDLPSKNVLHHPLELLRHSYMRRSGRLAQTPFYTRLTGADDRPENLSLVAILPLLLTRLHVAIIQAPTAKTKRPKI
jgi:hypothetical protein